MPRILNSSCTDATAEYRDIERCGGEALGDAQQRRTPCAQSSSALLHTKMLPQTKVRVVKGYRRPHLNTHSFGIRFIFCADINPEFIEREAARSSPFAK